MPYIEQGKRGRLEGGASPQTTGELTFLLYREAMLYLKEHGVTYATFNDIAGAFSNALDEFRRRHQHPYENSKRAENGDVW